MEVKNSNVSKWNFTQYQRVESWPVFLNFQTSASLLLEVGQYKVVDFILYEWQIDMYIHPILANRLLFTMVSL